MLTHNETESQDGGREARGKKLAATAHITLGKSGAYLVPSASHTGKYVVDLAGEEGPTCTCPDFELRGVGGSGHRCKHIHCVEYFIIREDNGDGTVSETRGVKVTYKQNWPAYDAAQEHEAELVAKYLRAVCDGIPQPVQQGSGNRKAILSDVIFAIIMKIYSTVSGRRAQTMMNNFVRDGLLSAPVNHNVISKYMEDPNIVPILKALIRETALPLRSVEKDFAQDSTGLTTCNYVRWFDAKYGREMSEHDWVKLHIVCGTKTNVITACNVTSAHAGDSPEFIPLLKETAKDFDIAEISADKAYLSSANLQAANAVGAEMFVPPKSNTTGASSSELLKLLGYFLYRNDEFQSHYGKRQNVEATMWMVKSKFSERLRAKTPNAQVAEAYGKVLCHNLCVLVQSFFELGVDPKFYVTAPVARRLASGESLN